MKFDGGLGIEGVKFEDMERNELKKCFSERMSVAHLSTGQKMLRMFMMRMMEIRNACIVIGFCKSYPLQIKCANGMNIVFAEPY